MLRGCTLNHVADITYIGWPADTVPQWFCQNQVRGQDQGCHFCVFPSLILHLEIIYRSLLYIAQTLDIHTFFRSASEQIDLLFAEVNSANPLGCKSFRCPSHSRKMHFVSSRNLSLIWDTAASLQGHIKGCVAKFSNKEQDMNFVLRWANLSVARIFT